MLFLIYIIFHFAIFSEQLTAEGQETIERERDERVPATRRRNAVNVALRRRLHKDVHRFVVSRCKRRFVMTETNDEARVSKIANGETISNTLSMSIYEYAFDKCYRFIRVMQYGSGWYQRLPTT